MTDVNDRLVDMTDKQRERLALGLQRFEESMNWQLDHARQELDRDRLRRLFGTS